MPKRPRGKLRIIGGEWRSRLILIPNMVGVRPTQDSVRETLFNWLGDRVKGATCLDLFAGSGGLGFEALSRGASSVTFIETDYAVLTQLKENIQRFDANDRVFLLQSTIPKQHPPLPQTTYDIVFIDPPFYQGLIEQACTWLELQGCLTPNTLIFIECEKQIYPFKIPPGWQIIKEKKAGSLIYGLWRVES